MGRYNILHACLASTTTDCILGPWEYPKWAAQSRLPYPPWLLQSDVLPANCEIDTNRPLPIPGWTWDDSAKAREVVDEYLRLGATDPAAAETMLSNTSTLSDGKIVLRKCFDFVSKSWDVMGIIRKNLESKNAHPWKVIEQYGGTASVPGVRSTIRILAVPSTKYYTITVS